jgi:hypothetical protein
MIKLNIFEKIFEIMEEYENKKKIINNYQYKDINKDIDENINKENNLFENDFFKFIFNNIKINKKEINNNKINEYNQKSYQKYNENYINNNISNNSMIILNNYSSKYNNNDNYKNYKKNNDNNSLIIKEYIKKLYKKIVLLCHPDKNGDKELFIKCQEYYNNNLLIGLLYIGYKIKINLPPILNKIIIEHIFIEIRIIQEKIKNNEV